MQCFSTEIGFMILSYLERKPIDIYYHLPSNFAWDGPTTLRDTQYIYKIDLETFKAIRATCYGFYVPLEYMLEHTGSVAFGRRWHGITLHSCLIIDIPNPCMFPEEEYHPLYAGWWIKQCRGQDIILSSNYCWPSNEDRFPGGFIYQPKLEYRSMYPGLMAAMDYEPMYRPMEQMRREIDAIRAANALHSIISSDPIAVGYDKQLVEDMVMQIVGRAVRIHRHKILPKLGFILGDTDVVALIKRKYRQAISSLRMPSNAELNLVVRGNSQMINVIKANRKAAKRAQKQEIFQKRRAAGNLKRERVTAVSRMRGSPMRHRKAHR